MQSSKRIRSAQPDIDELMDPDLQELTRKAVKDTQKTGDEFIRAITKTKDDIHRRVKR